MTRHPVGDEDAARLLLAPLRLMEYGEPDENGKRWGWWGPRNLSFVIFPTDGSGRIRSYACLAWGQSPDPASPHHSRPGEAVQRRTTPLDLLESRRAPRTHRFIAHA